MESEALKALDRLSNMPVGVLAYAATRGAYGSIKKGYEEKWRGQAQKRSTWQRFKEQFPGIGQRRGFFTGSTFSAIGMSTRGNAGFVELMGSWPTPTAKFPQGAQKPLPKPAGEGNIAPPEPREAADWAGLFADTERVVRDILGDWPETLDDLGVDEAPRDTEIKSKEIFGRIRKHHIYPHREGTKLGRIVITPMGVRIEGDVISALSGEVLHIKKNIKSEPFATKRYGAWGKRNSDFMRLSNNDIENILRIVSRTLNRAMEGRKLPPSTTEIALRK